MDDSRLTPRKMQILKAIVDAHITNGEPVGSKFLSQDVRFSCSPATIRNEMAELEEMGYLVQPYTSAGRVPSERGYRYYVDALVRQYSETRSEIDEINQMLKFKLTEMDELLSEFSRFAASFTDYTGIAFKSGLGKVKIQSFKSVLLSAHDFLLVMTFENDIVKTKTIHLSFTIGEDILRRFTEALNMYLVNLPSDSISMPIIVRIEALMGTASAMVHPTVKVIYETMSELDTADLKLDGITKLLQYPEYSDVSDFRNLLGVLEQKDKLVDVLSSHSASEDGIQVYIGDENAAEGMKNTTLIFKNISVGGGQLAVGVIGPKRMNYHKVIEMLNGLATGIDRLFGEDSLLPGGNSKGD
ncbi:MAG: heat-inducible transcription repressor HrcA [Clostridia bacterium]|nr:heat-inducible transcription repressor HrcA [Clostridia bacterium]MBP3583775.1 heat-inducible transcription repressor HrcA [Clostridia bacterium]